MIRRLFNKIFFTTKGKIREIEFLVNNRHNSARLRGKNYKFFDPNKVHVGKHTYGTINVYMFGNSQEKLKIRSYCSIGPEVNFILSGEHKYDCLSTYPTHEISMCGGARCKGPIVIEDDCWIGFGATVLSGVKIGQGSIIGAGCVIANNVEPYSIMVGNPANCIRKRFNKELIGELLEIDFSKISIEMLASLNSQELTYDRLRSMRKVVQDDSK